MRTVDTVIVGESEMSKRIQRFDWSGTGLGEIGDWPDSLVTSVNIVLQSPVPLIMLWGADGIMIYNDAYAVFAGKRHPQLLGTSVVDGWPEVADFNRNVMATVRSRGETLIYEDQQMTLYRNNAPEQVWMDLTYSPIIDESGKPNGVLAIVMETTERVLAEQRQKHAETALKVEWERLKSIFMQAPACIAIMRGPEHVFEMVNPMYLKLIDRASVLGKPVREALPEIVEQGFVKILDKVYKTAQPYIGKEVAVSLRHDDGSMAAHFLNFVYMPSLDENGKSNGILVHAIDVTDQVVARQQAEDIANLNKTITDNATTGLMIMDTKHFCTYMNPAAEKITGYTLAQIRRKNRSLHEIIHYKRPDGSLYPEEDCPTSRAVLARKTVHEDDFFVRADGSMYPVAIMSTPIIHDGSVVGIVEEIRDTTQEKEAENKIKQLNLDLEKRVTERTSELTAANKELNRSNEELQDFAYVASHDLQEPLRKIAAFSSLLESDYRDILPAEAHLYLEGLQKSSKRMRTLINDLLTYSRVTTQAHPFVKLDLNKIVAEVLDDLQARTDDTKAIITVKELGHIEGDGLQIRLLLQNLISNALKYAKPGARPRVTISSSVRGGLCTLVVKDNGIGFDEQYLDRIFTIFQRLHGRAEYEGTGVGLAICKKIAERHSGTITAKSVVGKGATFSVTLPVKQVMAPAKQAVKHG